MFVQEFSFTITEHDLEERWIVVGTERHTIKLDDGESFLTWAAERWPTERFTVQLDPWQLAPG